MFFFHRFHVALMFACLPFYSYSLLSVAPSYPNSEQDRLVPGASSDVLWVEGGVRLGHEWRLQDIPAQAILQEPALVKVHLLPRGLKVQSN